MQRTFDKVVFAPLFESGEGYLLSTYYQNSDTENIPDAEIESSDDPTSKKNFLEQCAIMADDLLVSIGMDPCAKVWVTPAFKEDRSRIMSRLVELRDVSEENCKITGDIAFFLNAPFLFAQSNRLKDSQSNNWANAILTSFNTFYMEASHRWPTYNPGKGVYTNYIKQSGFKVQHQSKDDPEKFDSNRLYIYKNLLNFEEEITSTENVSLNELKTRLHIKSGYSMTIIEGYFRWKVQRFPVAIDAENSPVANLPISAEQKSGKSHLQGPEDAAIENDNINSCISRIDELIRNNILPDHGKAGSIRDLILQIAYGNEPSASKVAKELGISKEWPRIRQKLQADPVLWKILEPKNPSRRKGTIQKTAKVVKVDVVFNEDEEDEEVSFTDITGFSKKHAL